MKRIIITILLIIAVGATHTAKAQDGKVSDLDLETFWERITTSRPGQEWKFKGERPAVIDFHAAWCAPCRAMSPVFSAIAKEYAGLVDFYKVDVDQEQTLAALFGIESIPVLLFIPKDGMPQMHIGALDGEGLKAAIDEVLLKE